MDADSVLKWVGAVGGSVSAIAVVLLKFSVDKRLSRSQEENQRKLEHLRQFLSGRISKIHEKEFEILPTAWSLLHTAHGAVARCTSFRPPSKKF
jgi:hypothetical protein